MAPITDSTDSDSSSSKAYPTRLRGKMEKSQKKYDDIFSSVFERITGNDIQQLSREVIAPISLPAAVLKRCMKPKQKLNRIKCMNCSFKCDRHMDLHEHLISRHSKQEDAKCHICYTLCSDLRRAHICHICDEFTLLLESHIRSHYLTKTGAHGLLECLKCYKTFKDMDQLREHEIRVHENKAKRRFMCEFCDVSYPKRCARDFHMMDHFETIVPMAFSKIEKLQDSAAEQIIINQCPLCFCVMGSRKSFRLHIIHKHLLQEVASLELLCSNCDPNEVAMLRFFIQYGRLPPDNEDEENMEVVVIKKEIKEEIKEELIDVSYESIEDVGLLNGNNVSLGETVEVQAPILQYRMSKKNQLMRIID